MTTTDHLSKLEQQAAAAEARAAKARADAQQAAAEQAERREARLVEYDRRRLSEFDPEQLEAAWRKAEADFQRAVLADPLAQAWVNYTVAQMRRSYRHEEARGDAARLGDTRPIFQTSPPGAPDFFAVSQIISTEASHVAYDENVRRGEDRQAYGEAANDGT